MSDRPILPTIHTITIGIMLNNNGVKTLQAKILRVNKTSQMFVNLYIIRLDYYQINVEKQMINHFTHCTIELSG